MSCPRPCDRAEVRTLGIDLAASPAKTGACEVDWKAGTIRFLPRPVTDEQLVDAVRRADRTGIDVPLGWPDAFVAAVTAHHLGDAWPGDPTGDRTTLRFRRTDVVAQARSERPLSVSTDLIGVCALRAARLQHLLAAAGVAVDRSGTTGALLEAYPAGALRRWGLASTRYKGRANADACAALVRTLTDRLGPLRDAAVAGLDGCDDDALDAFVCALVARAAVDGLTTAPSADDLPAARREGWIHVPTVDLEAIG